MSQVRSKPTLVECPICEDKIVEASRSQAGHDAVWCDGPCQAWLHRRCAGLTKVAFASVSKSDDKFFCPLCRLGINESHIVKLQLTIASLQTTVDGLVQRLDGSSCVRRGSGLQSTDINPQAQAVSASSGSGCNATSGTSVGRGPARMSPSRDDRKFNVVVFGVEEPKNGTPRLASQQDDLDKVSNLFGEVDQSLTSSSIKDLFRLGKPIDGSGKPRPILVKFVRATDASCLLYKRSGLRKPVFVKPDLSPFQRKRESILLRERWSLIQSGISRSSIKIRNSKLFLHNELFGSLDSDGVFQRSSVASLAPAVASPTPVIANVSSGDISGVPPPPPSQPPLSARLETSTL